MTTLLAVPRLFKAAIYFLSSLVSLDEYFGLDDSLSSSLYSISYKYSCFLGSEMNGTIWFGWKFIFSNIPSYSISSATLFSKFSQTHW